MKSDRNRRPGFYWVRFDDAVVVAEYSEGLGCAGISDRRHWHIPGIDECFHGRDLSEVLSGRIEPPVPRHEEAKAS